MHDDNSENNQSDGGEACEPQIIIILGSVLKNCG